MLGGVDIREMDQGVLLNPCRKLLPNKWDFICLLKTLTIPELFPLSLLVDYKVIFGF